MVLSRIHKVLWALSAVAVVGLAAGTTLIAQGGEPCIKDSEASECSTIPDALPRVGRGPQQTRENGEALVQLLFDDGTCESGLGAGTVITDLVDFDVPSTGTAPGLDIVGLTTRVNTGTATAFAYAQAGATPPPAGAVPAVSMTNIAAFGPCPATAMTSRALGPGVATITGTANFFAGLRCSSCWAGRDSNSWPRGRIWLNCGTCARTQYGPSTISALGLGGNWMIRVTVKVSNLLIPVELLEFSISDS